MPFTPTLQTTSPLLSTSFLSAAPATINGNFNILKEYASDTLAGQTQLCTDINAIDSLNDVFVTTPKDVYNILQNTEAIIPKISNTYSLGNSTFAYKSLYLSDSDTSGTTEFTIEQTPSGAFAYLDGSIRLLSTYDIPSPSLLKLQPTIEYSVSGNITVNDDINIGISGTTFDLPYISDLPYDKIFILKNIGSIPCPVTYYSVSGDTSDISTVAPSGVAKVLGYKLLNRWILL